MNIAINGFGRIGRAVFKALLERPGVRVVAINDLTDTATLAHLLKYDSCYGNYSKKVKATKSAIIVDGVSYPVSAEKDLLALPWKQMKVDVVIESTGRFTDPEAAMAHIKAGAKKVVLSAPAKGKGAKTFVIGVNENQIKKSDKVISMASCTTTSNPFFVVDSFANNSLLLAHSNGIMNVNPRTNEKRVITSLTPATSNTIIRSTITPTAGTIVWAQYQSKTKSSTIHVFDKNSFVTTSLAPLPGKTQSITSAPNGTLVVTQESTGATFLIHPDSGKTELIAPTARLATFSFDGRSLALVVPDGIRIFSLDNHEPNIYFTRVDATNITGLMWHRGSEHVLVAYTNVIRLLDLSDITLQEFDDVLTGTLFRYDPATNTVYGLDSGKLMKIVLPG
jgi:glyceraldehyde-3-phosphate dehydrogenase type I